MREAARQHCALMAPRCDEDGGEPLRRRNSAVSAAALRVAWRCACGEPLMQLTHRRLPLVVTASVACIHTPEVVMPAVLALTCANACALETSGIAATAAGTATSARLFVAAVAAHSLITAPTKT